MKELPEVRHNDMKISSFASYDSILNSDTHVSALPFTGKPWLLLAFGPTN